MISKKYFMNHVLEYYGEFINIGVEEHPDRVLPSLYIDSWAQSVRDVKLSHSIGNMMRQGR